MTTERDLIQRMADELDHYRQLLADNRHETHVLANEARSFLALAQPESQGASDKELLETAADAVGYEHVPTDETCLSFARAVLARWGRSAPCPYVVSSDERTSYCRLAKHTADLLAKLTD